MMSAVVGAFLRRRRQSRTEAEITGAVLWAVNEVIDFLEIVGADNGNYPKFSPSIDELPNPGLYRRRAAFTL